MDVERGAVGFRFDHELVAVLEVLLRRIVRVERRGDLAAGELRLDDAGKLPFVGHSLAEASRGERGGDGLAVPPARADDDVLAAGGESSARRAAGTGGFGFLVAGEAALAVGDAGLVELKERLVVARPRARAHAFADEGSIAVDGLSAADAERTIRRSARRRISGSRLPLFAARRRIPTAHFTVK